MGDYLMASGGESGKHLDDWLATYGPSFWLRGNTNDRIPWRALMHCKAYVITGERRKSRTQKLTNSAT
jgi:hypothetical protein